MKVIDNQTRGDTIKPGASPYNKAIEPSAGGRHVFRVRESLAGSAPALLLRRRACAPSSRLIAMLYGRGPHGGFLAKAAMLRRSDWEYPIAHRQETRQSALRLIQEFYGRWEMERGIQ